VRGEDGDVKVEGLTGGLRGAVAPTKNACEIVVLSTGSHKSA
jgi:hypothetical protein